MKFLLLFIVLLHGFKAYCDPPIPVKVGMYPFAPFVMVENESISGMSMDLIDAMNRVQSTYTFEPILIPPKRRYQSYKDGHYDIIFYESKAWGWEDIYIDESNVYQTGGEVYVALNAPARDQSYFDDLKEKKIIGIVGFHYGFAGFNANESYLVKTLNMILTPNNTRNFNLLLKGRGDVAIVTKAYLQRYLLDFPELKSKLLISEKLDQEYQHTILVRPKSQPNVNEINSYLDDLKSKGEMTKLLTKYGLPVP